MAAKASPSNILETTMHDFLSELGIEFNYNDRKILKNMELDFYIPHVKLGIEMNGTYWHMYDTMVKTRSKYLTSAEIKKYHMTKFLEASEKGITLFQIHEYEWLDPIKREIWKSRIKNFILKNNNKIYARKTTVQQITRELAREFLENNHLEGDVLSTYNYGLYHNDTLVMVATFGKTRFKKENSYELYRLASARDMTIVGGASKLLSYFIKNNQVESIISFSNNDYSNGNVYEKLGFMKVGVTKSHVYVSLNPLKKYNRFQFQKKKLKNIFNINDSALKNKCADDILKEHGIYKLYTSGQTKWLLSPNS